MTAEKWGLGVTQGATSLPCVTQQLPVHHPMDAWYDSVVSCGGTTTNLSNVEHFGEPSYFPCPLPR
jgi:hypothetical protein